MSLSMDLLGIENGSRVLILIVMIVREKAGLHREVYSHVGGSGASLASHRITEKAPLRCQYNETDGRILAYATPTHLHIFNAMDGQEEVELCRLQMEALDFSLSPSGRHLATFCSPPTGNLTTGEAAGTTPNLRVWRLPKRAGEPAVELAAFLHKQQSSWDLQWTADEAFFARLQGKDEVRFYRADDAGKPAFLIKSENLGAFSLSPGAYPKAAVFIKEANGEPAAVKVFLLPNTQTPVAAKHFF